MLRDMLPPPLILENFHKTHKSDINTGKVRCVVPNYLLNVCRSSISKCGYLREKLIEKVSAQNHDDIE